MEKHNSFILQKYFPVYIPNDEIIPVLLHDLYRLQVDDSISFEAFCLHKINEYSVLYEILQALLNHFPESGITVVIEDDYVDPVYRDSYYMHYAKKHFDYNRACIRLSFFEGNIKENLLTIHGSSFLISNSPNLERQLNRRFLGFSVLRPLSLGKIGRTAITPKVIVSDYDTKYIRESTYDCTVYGIRLYVKAFPYMMQDAETMTCAEVSLLLLLDYYGGRYAEFKTAYPSGLSVAVGQQLYERNLPSQGMSYIVLTKMLKEFGFQPRLYKSSDIKDGMKSVILSYVESAMPIAIGIEESTIAHSVVCIGHGPRNTDKVLNSTYACLSCEDKNLRRVFLCDAASTVDEFIVMDDNRRPYQEVTIEGSGLDRTLSMVFSPQDQHNYSIQNVAVPMHGQMALDALGAYSIVREILTSEFGLTTHIKNKIELGVDLQLLSLDDSDTIPGSTKENPIIIRVFLASTRSYKRYRRENNSSVIASSEYVKLPLPRFVWVCEVSTKSLFNEKKILGEIVLDATASKYSGLKSILLIQYPFALMQRDPKEMNKDILQSFDEAIYIDDWEPYKEFAFNSGSQIEQVQGSSGWTIFDIDE